MGYVDTVEFNFASPKIIFGLDSTRKLKEILEDLKCRKYLLVTDPNIEKAGIVSKIISYLAGFEGEIYHIEPHEPYIEDAEKVAGFVREHEYDVVIGVGGGAVLDLAKVASLAPSNPGKVSDYIGLNKVKYKGLHLVLIPTTAGTGSEVSPYIVLSTVEGIKVAIGSPKIMADYAIVDPMLTITMPTKITVSSGLDALSHAFEALMSKRSNTMTDTIALESISLIVKYLPIAAFRGDCVKARYYMSLASMLAGLAFSNASLVAGHAIAYTYAHKYKLPHGISCGLALPYIMDYNLPLCLDKFVQVARAIGVPVSGKTDYEVAVDVVKRIKGLLRLLKAPSTLRDIRVQKDELPVFAKSLITDYARLLPNNPRKIEYEDALEIFNRMWEGKVGEHL